MFSERKDHALTLLTVKNFMRNKTEETNKGQACIIDLQKACDTLDQMGEIWLQRNNFRNIPRVSQWPVPIWLWKRKSFQKHSVLKLTFPKTVLGLFCFLLYINDLQKVVKDSHIVKFAEDTTMVNSGNKLTRNPMKISIQWLIGSQLVNL